MTIKSWILVFLLLIIVSAGSVLATRYVLQSSVTNTSATLSSATSQTEDGQPAVQISKPDPIVPNSWQGYDSADVKCTQQGTDTSFPKGCTADFHISKKHITLPDLGSLAEVKEFDGASYAWVAQYENTIYVDVTAGSVVPGGSYGANFVYVFDEQHNTLNKLFKCDFYDCVQLAGSQGNLTAYAHRVNDDQGVHIYRDFIYRGELHSSPVAFIPKDNNGWRLGVDCRDADPCADGSDWITVLNYDNFVLRFDKRAGTSTDGAINLETKYVFVSTQ